MRQDEHPVALDNRVEPMSNRNDRTLSELLLDQRLDFLLSHDVNVCSGLIKHDDLVLAKDGPADTNKLAFASAQIGPTFRNFEVDALILHFLLLALSLGCIQILRRHQA